MAARFTRRWRRALLDAAIPAPPGTALPPMSALDLDPFWRRFDATAPTHLKLGLAAATWILGLLLPLCLHLRPFVALPEDRRGALLARAARGRLTGALVEVIKVVACLAFFHDPAVQRTVRGPGAS